jgi:N-acetyl-anhydromuramyl-L-alanine amidase AmpD
MEAIFCTAAHAANAAMHVWRKSEAMSGHYMVSHSGSVWQSLKDSDPGWQAGNRDFNWRSFGIAAEGLAEADNPESLGKNPSRQSEERAASLSQLVTRSCGRHEIAIDRANLIGTSQVPGVSTERFPEPGLQYVAGPDNKISSGGHWNWERLMEKLGRKQRRWTVTALSNCPVRTLLDTSGPLGRRMEAGKKMDADDSCNGIGLIILKKASARQLYFGAGKHHWGGWLDEAFVRETRHSNVARDIQ